MKIITIEQFYDEEEAYKWVEAEEGNWNKEEYEIFSDIVSFANGSFRASVTAERRQGDLFD